jgi:hypothetical protein
MAIKASLVSSIQVRTYGTKLYWVVVCLKNGRAGANSVCNALPG